MTSVTFDQASCVYAGSERPAVDQLDLEIGDGEFMVLVGPSGCGKSTSLRMLAGLEDVTGGSIRIGERQVSHLPPRERDIAMVFQNYALYPHMTVGENMGFALKIAKRPADEIRSRVASAATTLGLTEFLDRKPRALSGGQRQRVAMGRAIVREPEVFLMDEPLSNLDAKLRTSTRSQIAALQRRLGVSTLYVTHDQVEAMTMGDRVAVLDGGRLQQCDTPVALYQRPANAFVAGFIGSPAMNLHELDLVDGALRLQDHEVALTREEVSALTRDGGRTGLLGFRPESVGLAGPGEGFEVVVTLVEDLGADAYLYGAFPGERADDAPEYDVVARIDSLAAPAVGETARLRLDQTARHLFVPATGERVEV